MANYLYMLLPDYQFQSLAIKENEGGILLSVGIEFQITMQCKNHWVVNSDWVVFSIFYREIKTQRLFNL